MIKEKCCKQNNKTANKGFTLIELLVVVLIIGILAAIALPQYKMAIAKAKVAAILPIMRRWKDALAEYNLLHGSYLTEDGNYPDSNILGVSFPDDWECSENGLQCSNDFWYCEVNTLNDAGEVFCGARDFSLEYFQEDQGNIGWGFIPRGLICFVDVNKRNICESLGGTFITKMSSSNSKVYQL